MVGSLENSNRHISGVSSVARIFSIYLPRALWRWEEASVLSHVVSVDQDTLPAYVEGLADCGRSNTLQPTSTEDNINQIEERGEAA
jgi:hypothetical protein